MAKIVFNDKIIKHLPEPTIINFFSEKGPNGRTIFVRDVRPDVYNDGRTFIFGDVQYYEKDGDYYIDITPLSKMDNLVLGMYVSEGQSFGMTTDKTPIFVVAQKNTEMSLGMTPAINKGDLFGETMIGMFHLGTIISYKKNGTLIKDELTKNGWKRILGPGDDRLGIITTADAFEATKAQKEKEDKRLREHRGEIYSMVKEAYAAGEISPELAASMGSFLEGKPSHYFFLASDLKLLKRKGIL